jgi:hypothetical protein
MADDFDEGEPGADGAKAGAEASEDDLGSIVGKDASVTFEGGIASLIPRWEKRRLPFVVAKKNALPPADVDLAALRDVPVVVDQAKAQPKRSNRFTKRVRLAKVEFSGQSSLCLLNALLIMNLRKESAPPDSAVLFRRLWREHDDVLLGQLSGRWLISSLITFAHHGETEADRRCGQSMNVLFSLMKLYESERLYSGHQADEPFDPRKRGVGVLPMGMSSFAIRGGDLETNFLAPLLVDARNAPNAGRLAMHLLDVLNHDSRTLFRRLALMRGILAKNVKDQENP